MTKDFYQSTQNSHSLTHTGTEPFQNSFSKVTVSDRFTHSLLGRSRLKPVAGDGLDRKESRLAQLVNQYRRSNGLSNIKLSKALTIVANRHVRDLAINGVNGSLHAWSNAPYDSSDSKTYPSMWLAPKRLRTGYPGYGYENAFGASGANPSAQEAFDGWKNSPDHNAVILNQQIWTDHPWKALGVGIYKGFAVLWFGEEPDPTGKPKPTS